MKSSVLAVVLGAALAAPAGAATPDAWITTKTKLSLLTTEGVSGTAIHVDTILGKVTLHGKVRSAEEKAKAEQARRVEELNAVLRTWQDMKRGQYTPEQLDVLRDPRSNVRANVVAPGYVSTQLTEVLRTLEAIQKDFNATQTNGSKGKKVS